MVVDNSGSKVVSPAWKKNSGNKTKIFPAIYSPVLLLKFKEEVAGEYVLGQQTEHEHIGAASYLDYYLHCTLALSWGTQWFLNKGDFWRLFFSKRWKTCYLPPVLWYIMRSGRCVSRWGLHEISHQLCWLLFVFFILKKKENILVQNALKKKT